MFTGLIETMGTIVSVEHRGSARFFGIHPDLAGFAVSPGASVAVSGACLTLECAKGPLLYFTAVEETLDRTTLRMARPGAKVNLERALVAGGRFEGHIVLGHIDGVGTIRSERVLAGRGMRRTVEVPEAYAVFMAEKGSVAIDGISLTIAKVSGREIEVALIPRTLAATTMAQKRVGDPVNIECDVLARYLQRLARGVHCAFTEEESGATLLERMERAGL